MSDVTIRPVTPAGPAVSFALLDDDDLQPGVGGWESLERTRRAPAAGWVGLPETTYTITVMLDGLGPTPASDRSVESQCRQVESWGKPTKKTDEPPILAIAGARLLVPARSRWVLQSIVWGERIRSATTNHRVQQVVELTFLGYLAPTLVKSPAKRARDRKPKKPKKGGK